jgi:hypothetical protein
MTQSIVLEPKTKSKALSRVVLKRRLNARRKRRKRKELMTKELCMSQ